MLWDNTAVDDFYKTILNKKLTIRTVLSNDADPNTNDELSLSSIQMDTTNGGSAVLNINKKIITYYPPENFIGKDTFDYAISDENGESDKRTVTIEILDTNKPPQAYTIDFSLTGIEKQVIHLKGYDQDENDKKLYQIMEHPVHGFISQFDEQSGQLTYNPDGQYVGQDKILFKVYDGKDESNEATVLIDVLSSNINGNTKDKDKQGTESLLNGSENTRPMAFSKPRIVSTNVMTSVSIQVLYIDNDGKDITYNIPEKSELGATLTFNSQDNTILYDPTSIHLEQ